MNTSNYRTEAAARGSVRANSQEIEASTKLKPQSTTNACLQNWNRGRGRRGGMFDVKRRSMRSSTLLLRLWGLLTAATNEEGNDVSSDQRASILPFSLPPSLSQPSSSFLPVFACGLVGLWRQIKAKRLTLSNYCCRRRLEHQN